MDLSDVNREQLNYISAATIDRPLKDFKVHAGKKPGQPNLQQESTAHLMLGLKTGTPTNLAGQSFGYMKSRPAASLQGLESIFETQPFILLELHSDNGGEFLNLGCRKSKGLSASIR